MGDTFLGVPKLIGSAGAHLSPDGANGSPTLYEVLTGIAGRVAPIQATRAAVKALDGDNRTSNIIVPVVDGSMWRWASASTATDTSENLVLIADDTPTTGRWLRQPGLVDLSLPFTFATANGATLFTVPIGARLWVQGGYWEISTGFSGGTTPAIGLSSSAYSTAGDLLGGSSGDVAAVVGTTGIRRGTIGTVIGAGVMLLPGDTILFNRIASAFTAGVGKAHPVAQLLANPGA